MIRLLLVEHPEAVRRALRARLSLEHDLVQVGEADDAQSAIRLAEELRPDVILIDAEMPFLDLDGTVHALRERSPSSRIVILTQDTTPLACAGDDAQVSLVGKHEGPAALPPAIRATVTDRQSDIAGSSFEFIRERTVSLSVRPSAGADQWHSNANPRTAAWGALDGQTSINRLRPFSH
jgi:chemotaxis response regulator CheB